MLIQRLWRLLGTLVLLMALGACSGGSHDHAVVRNAWARTTADGQTTGVLYFTVHGGDDADVLTAVSVPEAIAAATSLHRTVEVGHQSGHTKTAGMPDNMPGMEHAGTMEMREVSNIPIPADRSVTAKPGGVHVMLDSLADPLRAGERFTAEFSFQEAGTVAVTVTVRD